MLVAFLVDWSFRLNKRREYFNASFVFHFWYKEHVGITMELRGGYLHAFVCLSPVADGYFSDLETLIRFGT